MIHQKRPSKSKIYQLMDYINHEAINCSESLSLKDFKFHATVMMRDAYQLDVDLSQSRVNHKIIKDLKDKIKLMQHPTLRQGQISKATYQNIKYIYQDLSLINNQIN